MPTSKPRLNRGTIVVVGPFPPPVHGMAKNTAAIAEELRRYCHVSVADISPGRLERGLVYHVTTVVKVLRAFCVIAANWAAPDRRLYVPVQAGLGTYYTIAVVTLARLLGYKTFVHHRSFAYINRRVKRIAALTRSAGSKTVHIFLCPSMKQQYCRHYPTARNCLVVSNARYIDPIAHLPDSSAAGLRLGHLSNLGPEKGLDDVLETTRRLLTKGVNVRLILAGPPKTPKDAKKIKAAKEEFGDALDYRGPVYGEHKNTFYSEIDVFLFPTRYIHEAQPNVVLEAMSFGVPTISYARGCVANDLKRGGGVSVPTSADFIDTSLPILIEWEGDQERLLMAKKTALARAFELKTVAEKQFERFIEAITGVKFGGGTDLPPRLVPLDK